MLIVEIEEEEINGDSDYSSNEEDYNYDDINKKNQIKLSTR